MTKQLKISHHSLRLNKQRPSIASKQRTEKNTLERSGQMASTGSKRDATPLEPWSVLGVSRRRWYAYRQRYRRSARMQRASNELATM
jgi:hypothetical protein